MKSKPATPKKSPPRAAKPAATSLAPAEYAAWLGALKTRVRSAQLQAAARVNHELLALYWDLGRAIDRQQKQAGWGASVIPRLSTDLRAAFPDMAGFSERNIGRMVAFHREYPELFPILPPPVAKLVHPAKVQQPAAQIAADLARASIVPQPAAQLDLATPASSILPQAAAKLPWAHHVILLEKVKNLADRLWYMQAAVEHGWSRSAPFQPIESPLPSGLRCCKQRAPKHNPTRPRLPEARLRSSFRSPTAAPRALTLP